MYMYIYIYKYTNIYLLIYLSIYIRHPRPWPRQGRRLGPPEVWNLLGPAISVPLGHSTHSGHSHLVAPAFCFWRAFKPADCQAGKAYNPSWQLPEASCHEPFAHLGTLAPAFCFEGPSNLLIAREILLKHGGRNYLQKWLSICSIV